MTLLDSVMDVLRESPLYLLVVKEDPSTLHPMLKNLEKIEGYELGPQSNYRITRSNGMKAIGISEKGRRIHLEQLLIDSLPIPENTASSYGIVIRQVSFEKGKVKIEGVLKEQIELVASNRGKDESGKRFTGIVKDVSYGSEDEEQEIELPDFEF